MHKNKTDIKNNEFTIFGSNSAGLKCKMDSLKQNIDTLKAGAFLIQESKLYKKGQIKIKEFQVFELLRTESKGGGLAIGLHESMDPVLISEGDDSTEILVVQGKVGDQNIRFINGYGPQESDTEEKRKFFFARLDEECERALLADVGVIIQMDANSKIKNDKHDISNNGKLLLDFVKRRKLTIVNTLDICKGTITRMRKGETFLEESTLDYFIVCEKMLSFITGMTKDENRNFVLTEFVTKKGKIMLKESDHNPLVLYMSIPWSKKPLNERK